MPGGSLPARISLVTLGVADVAKSTAFYLALGWRLSPASVPAQVSFLDTAGARLALFGDAALAADVGVGSGPVAGFRGVTLAINVDSPAEVDSAIAAARAAGARIVKPAAAAFWGGYTGYFADLDGYHWEVAHNPGWPLGPDGLPQLP